eukprot:COSAG05_NODE_3692_length_1902_cov_2.459235_1_plen_174_part_00
MRARLREQYTARDLESVGKSQPRMFSKHSARRNSNRKCRWILDVRKPTVAEPAAEAELVAVEPAPRPRAAQRGGRQDRRRDARAGGARHGNAEIVRVASLHVMRARDGCGRSLRSCMTGIYLHIVREHMPGLWSRRRRRGSRLRDTDDYWMNACSHALAPYNCTIIAHTMVYE